jgi:hypothetical protein
VNASQVNASTLACRDDRRRQELFRQRDWMNGVDFVEVLPGPALCVHFFGEVPVVRDDDHPDGLTLANVVVRGGRRIRDIQVLHLDREVSADPDQDDCLRVTLDKLGDFSVYQLCLTGVPGFDPRYSCADFGFRVDCPTDLDCAAAPACVTEPGSAPEIGYLAKDYASFRQLILDRLAVTMPGWRERHEADVDIALVEVLAYAADHLSYYQDAVATEAYLNTARQRISVRRHARLVDYALHEGLNARAWVTVWTDVDTPAVRAADLFFVTGFPELTGAGRLLRPADLARVPASRYLAFEPVAGPDDELVFRAVHREIAFHTWGGAECCLEAGATSATLRDTDPPLSLSPGEVLVFEEVKGAGTGQPADADPAHRHAVRLTGVTATRDELLGVPVVEIEWSPADALPFPLCLSARRPAPDCTLIQDMSVARGNVVLVDHGTTQTEPLGPVGVSVTTGQCACEGSVLELTEVPSRFTPVLAAAPLTFAETVDPAAPAAAVMVRDPRLGRPQLSLLATGSAQPWTPEPDLLSSTAEDRHLVAEVDDDGRAHLRFGDGELGLMPPAGTTFSATYRTGNGTAGNVGRDAIAYLVLRSQSWSGIDVRPRNPMPASGGADPEPTAQARLLAPDAFRSELKRAVTAGDYAQIAALRPGVQAAAAELRWTGSWHEARVAVDALGTDVAGPALLDDVEAHLSVTRRMGHDLSVGPATLVPLDIEVHVCVKPHYARGTVQAAILGVLGSGRGPGGQTGMFHPDNLTFGTSIRLSRIVAAVQAIDGVASVEVTRLRRLGHPDAGELDAGVLTVHDLEIAELAGDPSLPENGRLVLVMGGGR